MSSKVLLVEDEKTLSGIVRDALETMDFTVEQAYDGSELNKLIDYTVPKDTVVDTVGVDTTINNNQGYE